MRRPRIEVVRQGQAVVEAGDTGEILAMTPDGTVQPVASTQEAVVVLDQWAKRHLGRGAKIGVMHIAWRGVTPPAP